MNQCRTALCLRTRHGSSKGGQRGLEVPAVDRLGGESVALSSGGRRCAAMQGIRKSAREVLDQADERQRVGAREVDALVPVAGFEGVPVCANKSHSIATRDLFGVCDARGVQHVASGSGRGRHDARRPRAEHAPHDVERGCTKRETQGEVELARHHPVSAGSQCRRGRDLDDFEAGDSNRKIHLFETAQHPQAAFDGAGHDHRVIEREKSVWLKIGTASARRHRLSRLHLWGGEEGKKSVRVAGHQPWEVVGISFSADVKNEMAGFLPARPCCQLSELLGIYFGSRGRLIPVQGGRAAYFSLLRNAIARKVVRLGRSVGHMEAKYQAVRTKKRMTFFIELTLPAGLTPAFTQAAARVVPDATCDRKAMLRGLFLGCGSVNAPSARYHLEFVAPNEPWATVIGEVVESAGTRVGVMERSGQHVVYVKDGDGIVRLLSWMGASRAVMEFERVRVVREVSGEVNRRLNFETANIGKTVGYGLRQAAAIERLETTGKLDALPPALREMARWRTANPELNLGELAKRMKLSKSAVNHRLRRLQQFAEHSDNGHSPKPTRRSA